MRRVMEDRMNKWADLDRVRQRIKSSSKRFGDADIGLLAEKVRFHEILKEGGLEEKDLTPTQVVIV